MAVLYKCTSAQLAAYYDRISLPERFRQAQAPSLDLLSALQWHHICHIPYENLSLVHPRAMGKGDTPLVAELQLEAVFEKLVLRKTR